MTEASRSINGSSADAEFSLKCDRERVDLGFLPSALYRFYPFNQLLPVYVVEVTAEDERGKTGIEREWVRPGIGPDQPSTPGTFPRRPRLVPATPGEVCVKAAVPERPRFQPSRPKYPSD